MQTLRKIWLIARSVLIEAVRRREIYVIVLLSVALIAVVGSFRFFNIPGLGKFYHEIALRIMNISTALTVVVLAARQLPREFEKRTIYPLLAKPVGRVTFLAGKFLGVMLSGMFCFLLFMAIFVAGNLYLRCSMDWPLFLQAVYLQTLSLAVVASVSFLLSLVLNLDAAIVIGTLLYILAQTWTSALSFIFDFVSEGTQLVLLVLNFAIPQLTLFDLSGKVVHGDAWGPISLQAMQMLTVYGGAYALLFLGGSYLLFRRKAL